MIYGSKDTLAAPDHRWYTSYATIPLLVGYHINLSKTQPIHLIWNIGVDLGYRLEKDITLSNRWWGSLNILTGVEFHWKRLHLGIRGFWGMTNFLQLHPFHYQYTGLTTYLGYTFWDRKKAQVKRLERQQRKQLEK